MANAKPCWYKPHWHLSKFKIPSICWPLLSDYDVSMGFCNIAAFCVMCVWLHWFCARSSKGLCICWYMHNGCVHISLGGWFTPDDIGIFRSVYTYISISFMYGIFIVPYRTSALNKFMKWWMHQPLILHVFPHLTESTRKPVSLCA